MLRLLLACFVGVSAFAAEPVLVESFDETNASPQGAVIVREDGRGGVLHMAVPAGASQPGRTASFSLPIERLRDSRVFFEAEARATNVSSRPNPWNGVKVMLVVETPSGKEYPQATIPVGSFGWQQFTGSSAIASTATKATLVLGLEQVTGEVWFDNVRITARPFRPAPPPADSSQPIFRGHDLPRLRGAMAGHNLQEEDVRYFAEDWGGNLLRLQIFESAQRDRSLEDYDTWLEGQLQQIDRVLDLCEKYRVLAVIDLHSPPGGEAFSAGYVTARGRLFTDPAAQAKFIEVWQKIARRYQNRKIIWGFDLVNEPDDSMVSGECLDWNELAEKAGRAVREIDPERTLIVEPAAWGGPQGFLNFRPLTLPRIVYSFHFYQPHQFTHQGIHNNPDGILYPGEAGGRFWDKAALEKAMQPAFDFAAKFRVHLYAGEFSAIRTAPGESAARYLEDVIDIFEKHGCDWSYHAYREWAGWSLEHAGPLHKPVKAPAATDRQQIVTAWMRKNQRPRRAGKGTEVPQKFRLMNV